MILYNRIDQTCQMLKLVKLLCLMSWWEELYNETLPGLCFSALDAENEFLVQEALERLMDGRTVLIIAHRLSTIQSADAVAVLDQHRVMEIGSHAKLLANDQGLFRKLMEKQAFLQAKQKQALF